MTTTSRSFRALDQSLASIGTEGDGLPAPAAIGADVLAHLPVRDAISMIVAHGGTVTVQE